ncbi:MAG: DUF962 domain-containing protein [Rhodospirillaceae bacterium]|nr:DUF962 domain-containing protein [Rhodospirillaceae bacterium]
MPPAEPQSKTNGFRAWFLEQLAMYMAYHRNRRNQATHHVGVPLIVFSLFVAFTQVPIGPVTLTVLVWVALSVIYIAAVPLIGLCAAIFYGAVTLLAEYVATGSTAQVWGVAIGGFVLGWIIQLVGHVFEGRRPALTANILQIFMAPPFLIAEVFFALGSQKQLESTLQARSVKYN